MTLGHTFLSRFVVLECVTFIQNPLYFENPLYFGTEVVLNRDITCKNRYWLLYCRAKIIEKSENRDGNSSIADTNALLKFYIPLARHTIFIATEIDGQVSFTIMCPSLDQSTVRDGDILLSNKQVFRQMQTPSKNLRLDN